MSINRYKYLLKEKLDLSLKVFILNFMKFFTFLGISSLNITNIKMNNKREFLEQKFLKLKESYKDDLPNFFNDHKIIDREFILNLAFITQIMVKKSEISIDHGKILYAIVDRYCEKNEGKNITIVETGTAKGFSSICMAKALSENKCFGKIYTFDLIEHNNKYRWNNICDLDDLVSREEMLKDWKYLIDEFIVFISGFSHINLKNIHFGRINFAFIDGSHYGHDIDYEFNYISNFQHKGDQILFDDFDNDTYKSLTNKINELCKKLNYKKSFIAGNNSRNYLLATKS